MIASDRAGCLRRGRDRRDGVTGSCRREHEIDPEVRRVLTGDRELPAVIVHPVVEDLPLIVGDWPAPSSCRWSPRPWRSTPSRSRRGDCRWRTRRYRSCWPAIATGLEKLTFCQPEARLVGERRRRQQGPVRGPQVADVRAGHPALLVEQDAGHLAGDVRLELHAQLERLPLRRRHSRNSRWGSTRCPRSIRWRAPCRSWWRWRCCWPPRSCPRRWRSPGSSTSSPPSGPCRSSSSWSPSRPRRSRRWH